MTKDEAIAFVQREHQILECSFSPVYPHFDFRWDDEAEIIILDIYSKWGAVLGTGAIGYEGRTEEDIHRLRDRKVSMVMELYPNWTDLRVLDDTGLISWGSA